MIILCINSPLFAASISVGSGSFVDFGGAQISSANLSFENSGEVDFGTSQIVLTDFSNQASALVDAASAVLSISGNWFNVGEFRAMSSLVEFIDGTTSTSAISGQTTFNDLIVASATGKVLQFESGSQQSIENHLELTGVSGSLLTLVSSIDGDEAFLNLSSVSDDEVLQFGKKIRDTVLQWVAIPTSIGIATTKTLSKIANHIAKKEKSGVVSLVNKKNIDRILEKIEIRDVWGVGRQLSKFYINNGIFNANQLKNISNNWIKKNSNVLGSRTAMELRGASCISLEITQSKRKSCCVSRSFGKKVERLQELEESITNHCLNAAEKIRSESLLTKSITIFIRTSPFQKMEIHYSNSKTIDFPIATDNSIEIVKSAILGLKLIFKKGYKYQKSGIILSGLCESKSYSNNLFSSTKDKKTKDLMRSIDYTNFRYGRSTLSLAVAISNKKWKTKRQHFSKIDTADFDCLPIIKVS